ncbi:MAG TPA: pantoate--beta-alanine ligase [Cytophagaceae bacterium]|jgi:pantoate--beta-alanine ligase|nr:pantoate--beta-alanine ligase [Cytophagaceae bacterium]
MKLLRTIEEGREYCSFQRKAGLSIGFVPTMGALHLGHLSLINTSIKENNITIASIFVNPIQFNNSSDLAKYPRTLEKDFEMLEKTGCNAVFAPNEQEMYVSSPVLKIEFGTLENVMEGAFRPGHFSGVGIVVSKLFNILQPTNAYFGQKDLQQFLVIQQMTLDLSFPVLLHCCPIIREKDGLAMSSRNSRLSAENRPLAAKIIESLKLAEKILFEVGVKKTKEEVVSFLTPFKNLSLEYFEIADGISLMPLKEADLQKNKKIALCIAVFLDGVRLIDNIVMENSI